MSDVMSVIICEDVTKTFKKNTNKLDKHKKKRSAVDGVSFSIAKGEVIGYIGPNGAGKSTMIKMLCGILCPTMGKILVDGGDS